MESGCKYQVGDKVLIFDEFLTPIQISPPLLRGSDDWYVSAFLSVVRLVARLGQIGVLCRNWLVHAVRKWLRLDIQERAVHPHDLSKQDPSFPVVDGVTLDNHRRVEANSSNPERSRSR
jgi:hypothetical protein